jgi:regulator of RNase E activity RraA
MPETNSGAELPTVLTDELRQQLASVSTATLTSQLQARRIRSSFLTGLKPLKPGQRLIGRARTLRYVALREDAAKRYGGPANAQRRAIDAVEPGDVLVIEARGVPDAGTIGDIYAMSAINNGAVGIITDGALRDTPAVAELDVPVYHQSSHASTYGRHHMPYSVDDAVTCAGVFVEPGDVMVGDEEGVMVIPADLVAEVTAAAVDQEQREAFALERVSQGESYHGLFPLSDDRRPDYEAWLQSKSEG